MHQGFTTEQKENYNNQYIFKENYLTFCVVDVIAIIGR